MALLKWLEFHCKHHYGNTLCDAADTAVECADERLGALGLHTAER